MNGPTRLASWFLAGALSLTGCSPGPDATSAASGPTSEPAEVEPAERAPKKTAPARVDPRKGGVEIVLGEWAITPEAPAIRPGEITFVIRNRGTMDHGFEIELEGDSGGHGSGDLFKAESEVLGPGESTRMTMTLGPGLYKIECLVDGHDDMGMEDMLDVRRDAPFVKQGGPGAPDAVAIEDFAFAPEAISVSPGTVVTWTNADPAPHTVTGEGGFGSDTIDAGGSFSFEFTEPGTYNYRCAIHPDMRGKVIVE